MPIQVISGLKRCGREIEREMERVKERDRESERERENKLVIHVFRADTNEVVSKLSVPM